MTRIEDSERSALSSGGGPGGPPEAGSATEAHRKLREQVRRREELTAAAATELRELAAALAPDASAPHAPEAARLRRIADDLDGARGEPDARATASPSPAAARPRLLVADDEPDAREVLEQVLAPEYDVTLAADGEEALARIRAERPDVVLLDVTMPRVDGFQVLEQLRADPHTAEIPVIFVSGRGDDAAKVRSLDLGAVDYLQKPFSERELRARVERTLRLVRSQVALRELAQTDALTGLANLRAFRVRLAEEAKRARRYGLPLTCVMADMDQLKPINDELGHAAGDRAIAAVANVLRGELRETDFGARYGGDEFVILLPHTGGEEGRVFAERACARLRETVLELSGQRVALGASFGVACLDPDDEDDAGDAMVRAADDALYVAKRAGRGRVAMSPGAAAQSSHAAPRSSDPHPAEPGPGAHPG